MMNHDDDLPLSDFVKRVMSMTESEADAYLKAAGEAPEQVRNAMSKSLKAIEHLYQSLSASEAADDGQERIVPFRLAADNGDFERGHPSPTGFAVRIDDRTLATWQEAAGGVLFETAALPENAVALRLGGFRFALTELASDPRWTELIGCKRHTLNKLGRPGDDNAIEATVEFEQ